MTRHQTQSPPRGHQGASVPDWHGLGLPAGCTGALMAAYLLLRPYGDAAGGDTAAAAEAFASTWWVVAHVCGLLALASCAWLVARFASRRPTWGAGLARTLALVGTVLVLPYYGAETFALHVIGREALTGDPAVLELVEPVRNQLVAMTMFGLGLALLAVRTSARIASTAPRRSPRRCRC